MALKRFKDDERCVRLAAECVTYMILNDRDVDLSIDRVAGMHVPLVHYSFTTWCLGSLVEALENSNTATTQIALVSAIKHAISAKSPDQPGMSLGTHDFV